jgi:hypothetical protein
MEPAEELQRVAPLDLVREERLVPQLEGEPLVQRRLAREVARLVLERLAAVQRS